MVSFDENLLSSSLLPTNIKTKIYRTIILPLVLYGCETWSLTLTEERRLRLFKNRVPRRLFESKRTEVTGEWRKLRGEEIIELNSSPNVVGVIRSGRMKWAGHVARMRREGRCIQSLDGNP